MEKLENKLPFHVNANSMELIDGAFLTSNDKVIRKERVNQDGELKKP